MALSIKNAKTDRLARKLARRTGESLTEAMTRALELRLWRVKSRMRHAMLSDSPSAAIGSEDMRRAGNDTGQVNSKR